MDKRVLTSAQLELLNKYSYNNYVSSLQSPAFRLSRDDIEQVEKSTRFQSKNLLWNLLRLDRQTASGTNSASRTVPPTAAMSYGLSEEKRLKSNKFLIDQIRNVIETTLGGKVIDVVLECGMFLSEFGLFSASPDAYFLVNNGGGDDDIVYVPVEIKCPHTYKNQNFSEIRNAMGNRNDRYRVKHTALSVNKHGEPVIAVEQTDSHYRQMQRQMYVLKAPMCVYVVKFNNSYVVHPVLRNQTFYLKEHQNEKRLFEMFVKRNQNLLAYRTERNRLESLLKHYDRHTAKKLAQNGLFYDFGELKCIYCDSNFDIDVPVDVVLSKNMYCGDASIDQMSTIYDKDFIIHRKRVESLAKHNKNTHLADDGVYVDRNGVLLTFCCGNRIQQGMGVKHKNYCKYDLLMSK